MAVAEKLASVFNIKKGVHPPPSKNTAESATRLMPRPAKVVISMQQHVGAPCRPLVKKGDRISVGQLLGDSEAYVSAPIHSSVSGTVTGLGEMVLPNGARAETIEIENDGEDRLFDGLKPPSIHNKEDMVAAIRSSGLVGLGGAGFPTHIKFSLYKNDAIDTLVINGAECEPFITADYRECLENTWDIMNGIMIMAEHFNAKTVVIAVEDNKPAAIAELSKVALGCRANGHPISVVSIPSVYPQGAEKMLIKSTTGRRVPTGKLPSDIGCCVMNITSTAFVSRYLKDGVPLISRRVTVDGAGVGSPGNLLVGIGTPVADVVDFCGGFTDSAEKIIMGGPMMGSAICSADTPVLKQNNAILVFKSERAAGEEQMPCIKCGRCFASCPMKLVPTVLESAYLRGDVEQLKKSGVTSCMECGCCAYACPAKRQLVQTMRLSKAFLRKEGDVR